MFYEDDMKPQTDGGTATDDSDDKDKTEKETA